MSTPPPGDRQPPSGTGATQLPFREDTSVPGLHYVCYLETVV